VSTGFPTSITDTDFFDACDGLFKHPQIKANEIGVANLMRLIEMDEGVAGCNYFQMWGDQEVWDPVVNARLAWEGFFIITNSSSRDPEKCDAVPLPELQPFYGVLLWPNFEVSKRVKKELQRLRTNQTAKELDLRLVNCAEPWRTWRQIDEFHKV